MRTTDTVEEYILQFPKEVRGILTKIREIIKTTALDATESIAYDMPAYKTYGKPLVYFAGFKNHIGFYAMPAGHEKFNKELSQYKQGKGSVQFPLNQQIPYDLIRKMVEFRVQENKEKYNK